MRGVMCAWVGMVEQEGGFDSQRGGHWRYGRFPGDVQLRLSQSIRDMN